MKIGIIAIVMLAVSACPAFGQDIHFSHLNRQPLYQNPGNTGLFKGDLRLTGNFKDQWRNVSVPYSTFAAAVDGKTKFYGLNLGGLFFYDQVGDGKLQTVELQLSVAKQYKLTSDSVHCVSAGIQVGMNHRSLNTDKFYFGNQFDGIGYNPGLPTNEVFQNDARTNAAVAMGGVYTWNKSNDEQLTAGIALFNINRPDQGFFGQKIQRDRRVSIFGTYARPLNYDWAILPGIGLNLQGKYRELLLGGQARYTLINRLGIYRAVDGGIWFRNRDAVVIRAGVAIQNWSFSMSYDTNISKLVPASNLRGGLELSAHYIFTRFKPKKIIHRACPDYI